MAERDDNNKRDIEGDFDLFFPRLTLGPRLSNYYGDHVRKLFIGGAGAILVLSPLMNGLTPFLLPFEIIGALVLIVLAGLTNPKNRYAMMANAIVAGIGVVVFELAALSSYGENDGLSFIVHEAIAAVFIFSLYFSLKTVRSMWQGRIGKKEAPGDSRKTWEEMSNWTRDPRNN